MVSGDVSTGGSGESTGAAGTVTAIAVNGQTYEPTAGIVTIPNYPTSLEWNAINGRPTHLSDFTDDVVSGKYLPLSGGTITSTKEDALNIYRKDGAVGIKMTAGTENGWVGFSPAVYGAYIYTNNHYLHITTAGKACFDNKELIHSGNVRDYAMTFDKTHSSYASASKENVVGYGHNENGWKTIGPVLTFGLSNYYGQIQKEYNNNGIYIRSYVSGSYTNWRQFAFIDSDITGNAASATKLQTARTIWGQTFDGTGNVKGSISDTGHVRPETEATYDVGSSEKPYRFMYASWFGATSNAVLRFGANNANHILINTSGYVGINNEIPEYRLDVKGTARVSGSVVLSSTLSVSGKTTISNDLVVSGDVSTGGSGGGSSSGGSGDSLCLGPVELDMQSITSLGTFTQAQMDGFGLTTAVISNMLAGLYTKVIGLGGGDVYDYNGFGTIGSIIRLFLRQGNGESVDYTYTLYYDKTKWTVTEN